MFADKQHDGQKTNEHTNLDALTNDKDTTQKQTYSTKQLAYARGVLSDATIWRLRNPRAWAFVISTAEKQASENKQISGRQLVEAVRKKDFSDIEGKPTKTNNNYSAVFVRWLASEYPHLRGHIEFRTTALNEAMKDFHNDTQAKRG